MNATDRRPAPELAGATEALVHERASATPVKLAEGMEDRVKAVAPPPLPRDSSLRALEEWFIEAVTSPCDGEKLKSDTARVLTPGPQLDPAARLDIYRYAYRARLVECLADDYPALQYALGADAFEALCHEYIQRHPSSSPSLNFYGRHMATFCRSEAMEPFPLRRFAADLAALEWALVEALHARVADALSPDELQAIPVERWALARLPPSPAVRLVRSAYGVNAFFQAFKSGDEPSLPNMDEEAPSATAVYRTDMTLWRMALTPAMATLLEGLFRGETLGEALGKLEEGLSEAEAGEAERNVMVWFREWVAGASSRASRSTPRRPKAEVTAKHRALVAPLPLIAWVSWQTARGGWRWEFVLFFVLAPALAWGSERTRKLFWGLYPFALLGLVYDAMRFVKDVGVTPARLHICDLRALDARWFGAGGATVHDWFRLHSSPLLDAICAVPYGTFIYVAVGFAMYLYARDYPAMQQFGWTFLLVNVCGFVTYHLYPAAPPWYFHAHGCVADLSVHASEGPNLARVDSWLGVGYFAGFYGRSSSVFGAVPSLHVAYPLLVLLFGWPRFGRLGRALAALFFASMCFAAVYLDHHWILDVLLGVAYVLVGHRVVALVVRARGTGAGLKRAERLPAPVSARDRVAQMLATWFGCGYVPFAPGTAGTLGAIPLYLALRPLGAGWVLGVAVVLTFAGVWSASIAVERSGRKDPQVVVIDEVAGVMFVLAASPPTAAGAVVAVLLFRLFDQLKPWPAFVAERALPSGWGVVFDDVFAGIWGAGAMAVLANMGGL